MGLEGKIWSPCFFGITLQQGVQLIAGLNMALGVWSVILLTLFVTLVHAPLNTGEGGMSALSITVLIIVAIITLVFSVLHFILLFKGASERNVKKIKIFLITVLVLEGLRLISFLVLYISFGTFVIFLVMEIPLMYELWVVFCFFKELSNVDQYNGQAGGGMDSYGGET